MKLEEYLKDKNIWEEIKKVEPFPFIKDVGALNALLINRGYGMTLYSRFEETDIKDVALQLVTIYSKQWNKLIEIDGYSGDIFEGDGREIVEEIDVTEARTDKRDNLDKVSAFNDDELLTDKGSETTGANDLDGKTVRKLTDKRKDLATAYNNLMLERNNSIIDTVLNNVLEFLTLSIF